MGFFSRRIGSVCRMNLLRKGGKRVGVQIAGASTGGGCLMGWVSVSVRDFTVTPFPLVVHRETNYFGASSPINFHLQVCGIGIFQP